MRLRMESFSEMGNLTTDSRQPDVVINSTIIQGRSLLSTGQICAQER